MFCDKSVVRYTHCYAKIYLQYLLNIRLEQTWEDRTNNLLLTESTLYGICMSRYSSIIIMCNLQVL